MHALLKKIEQELPELTFAVIFDKHSGIILESAGNVSVNELSHTTAVVLQMLHHQQKVLSELFQGKEEIGEVVFENPNIVNVVRLLQSQNHYLYLSFDPAKIHLGFALKVVNSIS